MQRWKVSIVDTLATCQFPNPLDRIQFGTVGWQIFQSEIRDMALTPFFVQPGVVVSGVVRNDHNTVPGPDTRQPQYIHEGKEAHRVEFARFSNKTKFPISQSHGTKVSYAASRRMVEQLIPRRCPPEKP